MVSIREDPKRVGNTTTTNTWFSEFLCVVHYPTCTCNACYMALSDVLFDNQWLRRKFQNFGDAPIWFNVAPQLSGICVAAYNFDFMDWESYEQSILTDNQTKKNYNSLDLIYDLNLLFNFGGVLYLTSLFEKQLKVI